MEKKKNRADVRVARSHRQPAQTPPFSFFSFLCRFLPFLFSSMVSVCGFLTFGRVRGGAHLVASLSACIPTLLVIRGEGLDNLPSSALTLDFVSPRNGQPLLRWKTKLVDDGSIHRSPELARAIDFKVENTRLLSDREFRQRRIVFVNLFTFLFFLSGLVLFSS